MKSIPFSALIGLAGVADDEDPKAKRWGHFFEVPMLLLAIWIIVEWYLEAKGAYPESWAAITNCVVWVFFVIETSLLCYLVKDKKRYLLSNWINLLIIAIGVPILWDTQPYTGALRSLRVLLLLGILLEMSGTVRQILARNHLGLTLLVTFFVVLMAGATLAAIDPSIDNPWEGIWWAWVTVTTVGYGDVVPESPQGKIFGAILMVLGLGLFSMMTANFSAFLVARQEEELIEKEEEFVSQERLAIEKLEKIEERLENLERGLTELLQRDSPDRNHDSTERDST